MRSWPSSCFPPILILNWRSTPGLDNTTRKKESKKLVVAALREPSAEPIQKESLVLAYVEVPPTA